MSKILKSRARRLGVVFCLMIIGALIYFQLSKEKVIEGGESGSAERNQVTSVTSTGSGSVSSSPQSDGADGDRIENDFKQCLGESLPKGGLEEWITQIEMPESGAITETDWMNFHFHSGTSDELRVRFENEGEFFREHRFGVDAEGLPVPQDSAEGDQKIPVGQIQSAIAKIQAQQGMGPTFRQERKTLEFKTGPKSGQVVVFTKENDEIVYLAVTGVAGRLQCEIDREDGSLPCYCQRY